MTCRYEFCYLWYNNNHSANVSAFSNSLNKYGIATFPCDIPIIFPNIYIRNNLLNSNKFVFQAFEFGEYNI